ncbi:exodeoxyribonuclease V subunit gamma [Pseudoalteromonas denitrificans]|uniref:RecBCD enzyme subunit RecC n=1 Tax=Pseudoalteromonas denitrificans DSM 6059 TaxID=1123010 RepID=A0A1I1PU44_9GAMM|nr:exodeoxyribonuclease V subunit gamma [Pseudoalteromonas denitrificans]SFD13454.1 DNA helicase/exodeoxyribonuclease V, gamma subunit [Pseudoalteromonas denitrificans DSM 6059]
MLHIIQSNRLEALQLQLNLLLKQKPLSSPFAQEAILVQSPGMSQWIKIGLAQQLGIVAQVDFPLPSSFIWRLYQKLLPDVPAESAFNKNNMAWKLFDILPGFLNEPLFSSLQSYLINETLTENKSAELTIEQQKLFMLCEKIADVYDQYLMYRPSWLVTWQEGEDNLPDVDTSHLLWQPELWRRLVEHTTITLTQSAYHRGNMHEALLMALENINAAELKTLLPERLTIFGISALPNAQLEVFAALASKIDVFLYFFNPSEHYWGDLVDEKTLAKIEVKYSVKPNLAAQGKDYYFVGNPLLSSWGKLGRDYLEQLLQLEANWHDFFVDDFANCLLGKIQQEVYQLAFKDESLSSDKNWFISDEGKLAVNAQDKSIHLNDCHTPLREVEVLHDHLLSLFEQNNSLSPKDIIVMMPDVASYSPYIEAVFGSAENERFIPYGLADLAIEQEKPILSSFNQLVNLPFSRFGVSDILDLLQVRHIASHFKIEENELDQIRYWLDKVGVKWGLNGEHKTEFDQDNIELNTWIQGLNKLLLGVVQRDELTPFNDIYASDQVEGMAANILGKLLAFFDKLIKYKKLLLPDASLLNKTHILEAMISEFYNTETDQSWDLMVLENLLSDIQNHYDNKDYQGDISHKVMCYLVKQGLKEKGVGQRFLIGKINFCTLMPMRSVPFKVVCMLGLNDADYPRSVQPMGFDLLPQSRRQKGDRSRKLDDRYLFLEALLSAREHLYISYIGRSCFDNTERVPSTLVSELLEYIGRSFYQKEGDKINAAFPNNLIEQHHLQPFNSAYYLTSDNDSKHDTLIPDTANNETQKNRQSYNPTWMISPYQMADTAQPLNIEPEVEIEIDSFISALCQPQKRFYQSSLALKLPQGEDINKDEEPFSLDHLQRYFYLDEFLTKALKEENISAKQILQRGNLPLAHVGELTLDKIEGRISHMLLNIRSHNIDLNPEPLNIQISMSKKSNEGCDEQNQITSTLLGWLKNVSKGNDKNSHSKQLFYRPASVKAKDLVKAWLYHLIAHASNHKLDTLILGLDEQYLFSSLDKDVALQLLQSWFNLYAKSLTQPVPFFPQSALEYAKTQDINKAKLKFSGGQYIGRGEFEDPYIRLNFKSLNEVEQEFMQLSNELLLPLVEQLEEIV